MNDDTITTLVEEAVERDRQRQAELRERLLAQAYERWAPGKGPWTKEEDLDQVDLVWFEWVTDQYRQGLLANHVQRLVEEVRRARGWGTPPRNDVPTRTATPPAAKIYGRFFRSLENDLDLYERCRGKYVVYDPRDLVVSSVHDTAQDALRAAAAWDPQGSLPHVVLVPDETVPSDEREEDHS